MQIKDTVLKEALTVVDQYSDGLGGMSEYEQVVQNLAGGDRLLSADVSAEMAKSRKVRTELSGMSYAVRNVQNAAGIAGTAEDAYTRMNVEFAAMKRIAERAMAGCGEQERQELTEQYMQRVREIRSIVDAAQYNGAPLMDGSHSRDNGGLILQAGAGTGQVLVMYFEGPSIDELEAASLAGAEEAKRLRELVDRQIKGLTRERRELAEYLRNAKGQHSELVDMIAGRPGEENGKLDVQGAKELLGRISGGLTPEKCMAAHCYGLKRETVMALLFEQKI